MARVTCPSCREASPLEDVLAACTRAFSEQRWLLTDCPRCGAAFHLRPARGTLAVGTIDGGPGPCFIESSRVRTPGLTVSWSADHARITRSAGTHAVPVAR